MSEHSTSKLSQSQDYELLPNSDPIQQPKLDQYIDLNSRAIHHNHPPSYPSTPYQKYTDSTQKPSSPIGVQTDFDNLTEAYEFKEMRKIMKEQNERIQELQQRLNKERQQHNLEKTVNEIYTIFFNDLMKAFYGQTSIDEQNEKSAAQQQFAENIAQKLKPAYLKSQFKKVKGKINQIRQQLLFTSESNFYTIFNSHLLEENNPMSKHILQLSTEIQKLKTALQKVKKEEKDLGSSIEIMKVKEAVSNRNERRTKFEEIQKGYEKLSEGYCGMRSILDKVHEDQFAVKEYIEQLREDISRALQNQKQELYSMRQTSTNKDAVLELERKFIVLIEAFNTPQLVNREIFMSMQQQNYDSCSQRLKQLEERVQESKLELEKEKKEKLELQQKLQQMEKKWVVAENEAKSRLNRLQSMVREKNTRISELENTIIDHLEANSRKEKAGANSSSEIGEIKNGCARQLEEQSRVSSQSAKNSLFKKNKSQPFLNNCVDEKISSDLEKEEQSASKLKELQHAIDKQSSILSKGSSQKSVSICFKKVA